MRAHRSIALATWILERLSAGMEGSALAGDLLEELEAGRRIGWFWLQVLYALAANARAASRLYVLPLVFSAGWSLLYPAWLALGRDGFTQWEVRVAGTFVWPYSVLLQPVFEVLPLAVFTWIGLLVYLALPIGFVRKISVLRLLAGLSIGLNVLLLASVSLLRPGVDLHVLIAQNFYTNVRWMVMSIPLVLSLYAAILFVRPRTLRRCVLAR